jgi:serine/threonine protein kinase
MARHPLLLVHLSSSVVIPCHKRCYMGPASSIAHYRITSKLGEGGMGEVYRATDTKLNREVAIKVLPESFGQDLDCMARFTREAQIARLAQPCEYRGHPHPESTSVVRGWP